MFLSDLPVLVVDEWQEISAGHLRDSLESLCGRRFNYAKLFLEYWRKQIRAGSADEIASLSMQQFIETV